MNKPQNGIRRIFTVPKDLDDQIEEWRVQRGVKSTSEAMRMLISATLLREGLSGLRGSQSKLLEETIKHQTQGIAWTVQADPKLILRNAEAKAAHLGVAPPEQHLAKPGYDVQIGPSRSTPGSRLKVPKAPKPKRR